MHTRTVANVQRLVSCCALMLAGAVNAAAPADVAGLLATNHNQQALIASQAYLDTHPASARMRFLHAVALVETGHVDKAAALFKQLADAHPAWPEPANNLAVLYARRGDYEAARRWLVRALNTRPAYATAYANLQDVYAALAAAAYRDALGKGQQPDKSPVNLALLSNLGRAEAPGTLVAAAHAKPDGSPGARPPNNTKPNGVALALANPDTPVTGTIGDADTRAPDPDAGDKSSASDAGDSAGVSEPTAATVGGNAAAGSDAVRSDQPEPVAPTPSPSQAPNPTGPDDGDIQRVSAETSAEVTAPDSANDRVSREVSGEKRQSVGASPEGDGNSADVNRPPAGEEPTPGLVGKAPADATADVEAARQRSPDTESDDGDIQLAPAETSAEPAGTGQPGDQDPSAPRPALAQSAKPDSGAPVSARDRTSQNKHSEEKAPADATEDVEAAPQPSSDTQSAEPGGRKEHETSRKAAARALVERWRAAWSNQNVAAYLSTYGDKFQPDAGRTLAQWRAARRKRVGAPEWIRIKVRNMEVFRLSDKRLRVSFIQTYQSQTYRDRVFKTLILYQSPDGWRILRETSIPY